jgi:hypothetical protein
VPLMDVLQQRDKPKNSQRLLLSCGTQLMQQVTGINSLVGNERYPLFT